MSDRNSIQSVLLELRKGQTDFPHAESVLAAASNSSIRVVAFDPLEEGAPCSELVDLYEFRLANLSAERTAMRSELAFLVSRLPNDPTKRCHIAVIEIDGHKHSVVFSKELDRVYGCLKHGNGNVN